MADLKKKQIPLRLSSKLYAAIASWAEDDFRSVNGQIEYLLTECVKQRKKDGKYVSETIDEPFEIDIEWQKGWTKFVHPLYFLFKLPAVVAFPQPKEN